MKLFHKLKVSYDPESVQSKVTCHPQTLFEPSFFQLMILFQQKITLHIVSDHVINCILQFIKYVYKSVYMGHYQKMEQSLSLMFFSQARCPRFAFSMYNIIIRGALLEPHAISRFRVCYL